MRALSVRRRGPLPRLGLLCLVLLAAAPAWAGSGRVSLEGRASLGYDSNLLDASDGDRAAFAAKDPESFFVVSGMSDEFVEGGLLAGWRRGGTWRPTLRLQVERRQYLFNPIRSEQSFEISARLPTTPGGRLEMSARLEPQVYARHRMDKLAQPGDPLFRPEVYRRQEAELGWTQGIGTGLELSAGVAGSLRDDRAPFDARDRRQVEGAAGFLQSVGRLGRLGLSAARRGTWSRNTPELVDDLSNTEWLAASRLDSRIVPWISRVQVELELGWRRYLSRDPADQNHYGRRDRSTQLDVRLTRELRGSLASETRFTRRFRSSNLPLSESDEDDVFDDAEIRTGVSWAWERRANER